MEIVVSPQEDHLLWMVLLELDYIFQSLNGFRILNPFGRIRIEVVAKEYEVPVGMLFDSIPPETSPVNIGDNNKSIVNTLCHSYRIKNG